jgi:2-aminoadipate transaminase
VDPRIDRLQRISAKMGGVLGLAGGLPADELFPRKLLADAFLTAVSTPSSGALQYGWPEGSEGVRRWIAERLAARGASITADDVIVTSGAQQALAIATELIGVAGKAIEVDAETYPAALDLFRSHGATTVAAGTHPDPNVAASYVVTGVSNPRGVGISAERRAALLASSAPLVVDEAYAELRFDGKIDRPLLADARGRVFHVGTCSKTLCPGLRVGWLVPPASQLDEAMRIKRDNDLQAGSLAQAVLEAYLKTGDFDTRLVRARRTYATRAARLSKALRRHLPSCRVSEPEGGFALWLETDLEGVDEARALSTATSHGVTFDPGSMFRASEAPSPLAMRLCCSTLAGEALDEAARRLARALSAIRRDAAA